MKKIIMFISIFLAVILSTLLLSKYFKIPENTKPVNKEQENTEEKLEIKEIEVINTSETDAEEIIEEYFAKGMSTELFKQVMNTKTEYLEKTGTYEQETYNFEKLLTYEEIENIIKNVNNLEVVNTEIIGQSVDKRNIYSLEIGKGRKTIMFEGNIHAAEVASPMFLMRFITKLLNDYTNEEEYATEIINNYKLVIIPSLNPDGYTMTLFGVDNLNNKELYAYTNKDNIDFNFYKANANGIDINRNFPTQTGGLYYKEYELIETVSMKESIGNKDYYAGEYLGSEPETQAAMYWMHKHIENAYLYISMHSAGRVIYSGKPNLANEYNDLSYDAAEIINYNNDYIILNSEYEEVGQGNDGTSTDYISEIASDFKFSTITGRLSTEKYDMKTETLKYKIPAITLETLSNFTFDLSKIKNEYYEYNLEKIFIELITAK